MKIFPILHVQTHIYKSLLLLQQFSNSCEAQQPCTTFPLHLFTSVSACASAHSSSSPLVAIRVSWLQFWLSRWVLF